MIGISVALTMFLHTYKHTHELKSGLELKLLILQPFFSIEDLLILLIIDLKISLTCHVNCMSGILEGSQTLGTKITDNASGP